MKSIRVNGRWVVAFAVGVAPVAVHATNGMNLEGYGPVAAAVGGAAMAYDNGTAAMMNNPATLGLAPSGDRLDLALGMLGPDVKARVATAGGPLSADSDGTAYYMPAAGWVRTRNGLTYGVGVYGQGGMGTEYARDTWLADPAQSGATLENRSELSVGRLIAPLAYAVDERLTLGGSVDFVWAGLDLKMALSGAQFGDLVSTQQFGRASGSLVDTFMGFGANVNYAQFNFSNGSDFTGEAMAVGVAGKIGLVYRLRPDLRIGAAYHSKTRLQDMSSKDATVRMDIDGMGTVDLHGKIKVKDFQWPTTFGVGLAYAANDQWTLYSDVKRIQWSGPMQDFAMQFTADQSPGNDLSGAFGNPAADMRGKTLDATLFQDWEDQTVVSVGAAYRWNRALTLRAGVNHGSNPVPDRYVNALFPAIVQTHYTAGFGYALSARADLNFSTQYAHATSATNPGNGTSIPPVTSRHSQLSWQAMYSVRF